MACNRIADFHQGKSEETFQADLLAQDAILRQIEVLGEIAKRIREEDEAFYNRSDMAELYRIIGMRNRIAHEYLNVDPAVVWQVASVEAPRLRSTVIAAMESLNLHFDPDSLHF